MLYNIKLTIQFKIWNIYLVHGKSLKRTGSSHCVFVERSDTFPFDNESKKHTRGFYSRSKALEKHGGFQCHRQLQLLLHQLHWQNQHQQSAQWNCLQEYVLMFVHQRRAANHQMHLKNIRWPSYWTPKLTFVTHVQHFTLHKINKLTKHKT